MSEIDVKIVKISKIEPHENADRLSLAIIGDTDYRCIIQKGQFNEGDLCIYIPSDAVITQEMIEKLQANSKITIEPRIRPVKIRGVFSEGLCLIPSDWVPQDVVKDGADVKELLGIKKFEPTEQIEHGPKTSNKINFNYKNNNFIEYKCVEKYKKYPKVMEEIEGDIVATIKRHGMNSRFGLVKKIHNSWLSKLKGKLFGEVEFLVGSHSVIKKPAKKWVNTQEYAKEDSWWKIAKKYNIENKVKQLQKILGNKNTEVVVYGEIYGPGCQKGYDYGVPAGELELVVFDIMVNKKFLGWDEVVDLCNKINLPVVEVVYRGSWNKELISMAESIDIYNGKSYNREGIVLRPIKETWHPKCGRVIMKYLNEKFLMDKTNSDFH